MAKAKKSKRSLLKRSTRINEHGLTELQERFCHEFIRDYNATQAMKRAGSRATGVSLRNAAATAMRRQTVSDRIDVLQKELFAHCKSSSALVMNELLGIAMFDPRQLTTWGPNGVTLKPSKDLLSSDHSKRGRFLLIRDVGGFTWNTMGDCLNRTFSSGM